jgi:hypothetical protein
MTMKKYMYGKAVHDITALYGKIDKTFAEYMAKMLEVDSSCFSDGRVKKLMIALRSEMAELVDQMYKSLKIELKYGFKPKISARWKGLRLIEDRFEKRACEICAEDRATNACHIVPREDRGQDIEQNFIYLCPTHHFLFDQARLSREEFDRISIVGKSEEAIQYFNEVHIKRHMMLWKYGTQRFRGCTCGSIDFHYEVSRDEFSLIIYLTCDKCGEQWRNVLMQEHPIWKVYPMPLDLDMPKEERDKLLAESMEKMQKFIKENLVDNEVASLIK